MRMNLQIQDKPYSLEQIKKKTLARVPKVPR